MTWWLRTRRVWLLCAAVVFCGAGSLALQGRFAAVPVIVGVDGMTMWSTFLPLVWAVAVADCFASKAQSAEVRPSLRAVLVDVALLLGAGAIAAVVFAVATVPPEPDVGAAGHVLIMTGLACSLTLLQGPGASVLAACVVLMISMFYGVDAPAAEYVRVLHPDGNATWALVVGVCACLLACYLMVSGRTKSRLGATDRLGDH